MASLPVGASANSAAVGAIRARRGPILVLKLLLCSLMFAGLGASRSLHASLSITNCAETILLSALTNGGSLKLTCSGTLRITNTIVIATNVFIDASGQELILDGLNSNRLFHIRPGAHLTLKNVTLANGRQGQGTNGTAGLTARGGAIYNERGSVILEECRLLNHVALGNDGREGESPQAGDGDDGGDGGFALGGAVYNDGVLIINKSVFFSNSATGGRGGRGGHGSAGGLGGHGGDGGSGGDGRGGAVFNTRNGMVQVHDSIFSSNRVAGATAGALGLGRGALGLDGRSGAPGSGGGGAIFNDGGKVTIVNSTFAANTGTGASAFDEVEAIRDLDGADARSGGRGWGGGVLNFGGTANVTNTTFYANLVAGGAGGEGGVGGTGGFGGDGGKGGDGGDGVGAGFCNTESGTATLVNCTFGNNGAQGGPAGEPGPGGGSTGRRGRAGSPGRTSGGGVFGESGELTLKNTIVANSVAGGGCGGSVLDGGNNLSSDATCRFDRQTSWNETDPRLGPLQVNEQGTPTLALLTNSPAINRGDDRACLPTDQRHARRAGVCDIGAYEFNGAFADFVIGIQPQSSGVTVAWPASAAAVILESSDALGPAANWQPVAALPVISANQSMVSLTATNQARFFRLRRP